MESSEFIDYYEILEISPNANSGTVERMFRYLAKRYHPDNQDTGDRLRFQLILDANDTLKDPAKRAQYDIHYKAERDHHGRRERIHAATACKLAYRMTWPRSCANIRPK
jgi:curved DNA-binding protein CbpA